MMAGAVGAISALGSHRFGLFFTSFLVLFVATGVGNGSVYRMIPAAFRVAGAGRDAAATARAAAGCIGIAGAVGALGGFLVPRGFAMSTSLTGSLVAALWVFVGAYAVMAVVTWAVYARPGTAMRAARV